MKSLIEAAGKDFVGSCLDSGNPLWTIEDPHLTLETLAPYVLTSHVRDTAVWNTPQGAAVAWQRMGDGNIGIEGYVRKFAEKCPGRPLSLEIIVTGPALLQLPRSEVLGRVPRRRRHGSSRASSRWSKRGRRWRPRRDSARPKRSFASAKTSKRASSGRRRCSPGFSTIAAIRASGVPGRCRSPGSPGGSSGIAAPRPPCSAVARVAIDPFSALRALTPSVIRFFQAVPALKGILMFRLYSIAVSIGLTTAIIPAIAQTPPAPATTPAPATAARQRPTPPTRDPHTPGYVEAKELPDGEVPPANADGNFIIGPTHNPAPEMTVQEGVPQGTVYDFTMESKDSKIYPGIAREPGTFGHAGSERSRQADRDDQPSGALHAARGRLRAEAIRPRHGRAVHRRRRWSGPAAVHGAR